MNLYIDGEDGITRDSCHPNFNRILNEDFYINIINGFSPFGSDEGWQVLRDLEKFYLKEGKDAFILDFVDNYLLRHWNLFSDCLPIFNEVNPIKILEFGVKNKYMADLLPEIIIAVAFGQLKILGNTDDFIRDIAKNSLRFKKIIASLRCHYNISNIVEIYNLTLMKNVKIEDILIDKEYYLKAIKIYDQMDKKLDDFIVKN